MPRSILLGSFLVCLSTFLNELLNEGILLLDFLGKRKEGSGGRMGIFEGAQMPRASLWKDLGLSHRQLEEPQKEPEQIPLIDTGTGCF